MHPMAEKPFIIPDATFLFELVSFFVLLFVLTRYVFPILSRVMSERQEVIRRQIDEAKEARERADAAEADFRQALADAKAESSRIREDSYAEGKRITEQIKAKAQEDAAAIVTAAHRQVEIDRQRAMSELRSEVGQIAVDLAGRIVGESLEDQARQSRTVDRFLEELETTSGERAGAGSGTDNTSQGG